MLGYSYKCGTARFDLTVDKEEMAVLMDYYYDMATKALAAGDTELALKYLTSHSGLKGLLDEVDNPAE